MYEFISNTEALQSITSIFCKDGAVFQEICAGIIFLIGSFDSQQLNSTLIPVMLSKTPAGASVKQIVHYGQGVKTAKFRKYDYGIIKHLFKHGYPKPPVYGINNIDAPVALFYSKHDWLTDMVDIDMFATKLPNLVKQYLVPFDKFNHLDLVWAIDVVPLLLKKY